MAKRKTAPYLILSLVLLFNPNINVIDLLPDFIAYFLIARMLVRAADSAPYFEEARDSAMKLGWLSLAKIPAFVLIIYIRSANTLDRDIFPLMSLIFAVLEIWLTVKLINNISSAFFYLGERGGAVSLISPFPTSKKSNRTMRPEELRAYTVMFAVCKCILYCLPEFFMLSGTTSDGTLKPSPLARYYPWTILAAIIIGFIMGGVWLSRAKKYAYAVADEGKFTSSLAFLARAESEKSFQIKCDLRSMRTGYLFLIIASLLSFPIALKETEGINILPSFLFALAFLFALKRLKPFTKEKLTASLISGAALAVLSVLSLIFTIIFTEKFDYINLVTSSDAKSAYLPVMIFSTLEFLALAALWIFAVKIIFSFVEENTGLSPSEPRYSRTERAYHSELKKKAVILASFATAAGLAKCVNVYLSYFSDIIYTDVNNSAVAITTSALPWFNLVIAALSVIYIGFTVYYTGVLREESEMKYSLDK